jgi:L-rhamnose mutarotase
MRRVGMVIGIRPEHIAEYKRLHLVAPQPVLDQIARSNIRNFVIYLREPENLLFAHFDYTGRDLDADMALMAADPATQAWWKLTDPCQIPMPNAAPGEKWSYIEEVFFAP